MSRVPRAAAALGLVLGLGACTANPKLEPCNIAQRACQEDVFYGVVRLRGDGYDPFGGIPPIHTITLDQYRQELVAADAAQKKAAKAQGEPSVNPWTVALQELGLVTTATSASQASIDDRVRNVAAFYSSVTGQVTVLDRGQDSNEASDTTLLAHELVHAFQGRERAGERVSASSDGFFANQAFIEGEATLYEHLAQAEIEGIEAHAVNWDRYYGNWENGLQDSMASADSPYYSVSWFEYPLGADYLTRAWLTGGNAAVRRLGTDFPGRGVDLMAAFGHGRAGTSPALSCRSEPPADGYKAAGFDRFGAMQLYAFLVGTELGEHDAFARALRWRDDLIWVYFDDSSQQTTVAWKIRMASSSDAEVVASAAARKPETDLSVDQQGRDVLITAGDDADAVAQWAKPADCDP